MGSRATAADTLRSAIGSSTGELFGRIRKIRVRDRTGDVHRARVAARRISSHLRTFGPLIDDDDGVASLRSDLRMLGRRLGTVRDIDVLRLRLDTAVSSLEPGARPPARAAFAHLADDRRTSRVSLLEALDDGSVEDLEARLVRELSMRRRARHHAAKVMRPLAEAPMASVERAVSSLGEEPSDEDLHSLRLRVKRARYACEAIAPAVGRSARKRAYRLADLQDILGDLHDAVVAEQSLRAVASCSTDHATLLALGEMIGHEREAQRHDRAIWPAAWDRILR